MIDNEINRIVMECFERAKSLIKGYLGALNKIAQALLEKEVLEGEEMLAILREFTPAEAARASS